MLGKNHKEKKAVNGKIFLTTLENIRFLARQGLPFRNLSDVDSKFIKLLSYKVEEFRYYYLDKKKTNKYSCPEVRNECLQIMALHIIRGVSKNVGQRRCFTNMPKECTDIQTRNSLQSVSDGLVMIIQNMSILLGFMRYRISLLTPLSMPSRSHYFA